MVTLVDEVTMHLREIWLLALVSLLILGAIAVTLLVVIYPQPAAAYEIQLFGVKISGSSFGMGASGFFLVAACLLARMAGKK